MKKFGFAFDIYSNTSRGITLKLPAFLPSGDDC